MADTEKPSPLRTVRLALWGVVALASLGVGFMVVKRLAAPPSREAQSAAAMQDQYAALGQGIDDVALTNSEGVETRWGALTGKPRALFFGFTHCPEICPTTLADLDAALDSIGAANDAISIDFVTIDPERDDAATLHAYFAGFDRPIRGFTGEEAQIARLAGAYRAAYRREPTQGGDYTMNHTTLVYLLDRDGKVIDVMGYGTPPARMAEQLRALLAHAA